MSSTRRLTTISGFTTGQITWVSFLLRSEAITFDVDDLAFLSVKAAASTAGPALGVFNDPDNSNKTVFGIGNESGPLAPVFSTMEVVPGTTYLLVSSITWDVASGAPETVRLFVNPDLAAAPNPADAIATRSDINIATGTGTNRLFTMVLGSAGPGGWTMDEIRIASDFQSVVVPEPASIGLVFGALVLVLGAKRRRRKARISCLV